MTCPISPLSADCPIPHEIIEFVLKKVISPKLTTHFRLCKVCNEWASEYYQLLIDESIDEVTLQAPPPLLSSISNIEKNDSNTQQEYPTKQHSSKGIPIKEIQEPNKTSAEDYGGCYPTNSNRPVAKNVAFEKPKVKSNTKYQFYKDFQTKLKCSVHYNNPFIKLFKIHVVERFQLDRNKDVDFQIIFWNNSESTLLDITTGDDNLSYWDIFKFLQVNPQVLKYNELEIVMDTTDEKYTLKLLFKE